MGYYLKPLIRSAKSYYKNTRDFFEKRKSLGKVLEKEALFPADVVSLFLTKAHGNGLISLSAKLEK